MAYSALTSNDFRFGLLLLLGFELFLRTGELLLLRIQDFLFGTSTRSLVINLGLTKSGKRRGLPEQVTLRNPRLIVLCRLVLADVEPGEYVFPERPCVFRDKFRTALEQQGIQDLGLRPYSLRRGGITAAFQEGWSFDQISDISRHANCRTLRIYVTDAHAELLRMGVPPATMRNLASRAGKLQALLG